MKPRTLWFIVPAHGRVPITNVCLRQLRWACDQLAARGIRATAVVIADDENLDIAHELGFATVERDNTQLGRKINDGYELAGACGVEFMCPVGSDDWIDPEWIALPGRGEIMCARNSAVVREDGRRLARLRITYQGGDGVRVFPRHLLQRVNFRPAAEDRNRAIDTATNTALMSARPRHVYHDLHPLQIVDFKSGTNLNGYKGCLRFREGHESSTPWDDLAAVYPAEFVAAMRDVYDRQPVAA